MTWEPLLVTSKVSVPAGASVAETSQASSVELDVERAGVAGVTAGVAVGVLGAGGEDGVAPARAATSEGLAHRCRSSR